MSSEALDAQSPAAWPRSVWDHIGATVMHQADALARHSDEAAGLTVAYLTPAHCAVAAQLLAWMRAAGMQAHIDALGNVVGRYAARQTAQAVQAAHAVRAVQAPQTNQTPQTQPRTLITGSHYDTVRNGGRYDGRLGILLPIAVVAALNARGQRLDCDLEIVAFAEEEGLRFRSSFLSSSALAGRFDAQLLERLDADGISVRTALQAAGLPGTLESIAALKRDPAQLAGYIEVHIEQGPVLLGRGLPLGVVTSIAGSVRMSATVRGVAGHSGTTPMTMRQDAAAAAAEMLLAIEQRCSQAATLVGTVGMLNVPQGATNVVPGRCDFSIDIRAADDATRDAAVTDVLRLCESIAVRRQVQVSIERTMQVACAPCAPDLMAAIDQAVASVGREHGFEVFHLPSGAGHDAMMMSHVAKIGMLFVRCGAGGISHNPAETMTVADAGLAARAFAEVVHSLR